MEEEHVTLAALLLTRDIVAVERRLRGGVTKEDLESRVEDPSLAGVPGSQDRTYNPLMLLIRQRQNALSLNIIDAMTASQLEETVWSETALQLAVGRSATQVALKLMKRLSMASLCHQNWAGYTFLHGAAQSRNVAVLQRAAEMMPSDQWLVCADEGNCPLQKMSEDPVLEPNFRKAFDIVLEATPLDIHLDPDVRSPICCAAEQSCTSAAQRLIEFCGETMAVVRENSEIPLALAIGAYAGPQLVLLLLEHTPDEFLVAEDSSMLHLVAARGELMTGDDVWVAQLLQRMPPDGLRQRDSAGMTAFEVALEQGDEELIDMLRPMTKAAST